MRSRAADLKSIVADISSLTLTGSGSSEYAGDCVRAALQNELGWSHKQSAAECCWPTEAGRFPQGGPA